MLLAFEGTGWMGREDLSGYTGPKGGRSFVYECVKKSRVKPAKYFPGPNVGGTNCQDILSEAISYYQECRRVHPIVTTKGYKISLVGYSRGAYIAMCFAKYLDSEGIDVHFLGMFDAVKRNLSIDCAYRTNCVPNNVRNCYHAARSPTIGSRNFSMNYSAVQWESGVSLNARIECPGSHAAMGGFPNEQGTMDSPSGLQGDPNRFSVFHPRKEVTAWWESGNFISTYGMRFGVLGERLVGTKPVGYLYNKEDWYRECLQVHDPLEL